MKPILEAAQQLSRSEQINLLYYLTRLVNKEAKIVHLTLLPSGDNPLPLTNEELEILLEWLTRLIQQEKARLELAPQKRLQLIMWLTDSFMQDIPQWGAGAEFWPEDDIEEFDPFLATARGH